jgi:hypothetical protein
MSELNSRCRAFGTRSASLHAGLFMGALLIAPEAVSLEEILVTAQKRDERLIDVPISVSVVDDNTWTTERPTF